MKQTDELSVFELYYIIALDGGVYNRSRAGDELVDPSVLSTDPFLELLYKILKKDINWKDRKS